MSDERIESLKQQLKIMEDQKTRLKNQHRLDPAMSDDKFVNNSDQLGQVREVIAKTRANIAQPEGKAS